MENVNYLNSSFTNTILLRTAQNRDWQRILDKTVYFQSQDLTTAEKFYTSSALYASDIFHVCLELLSFVKYLVFLWVFLDQRFQKDPKL